MDALRRGWVGLALFLAALVLMPVLALEYNDQQTRTAAASGPADLTPTLAPDPARSPSTGGIIGFEGVTEGQRIAGFQQITVETSGDVGGINFLLIGPSGQRYNVAAPRAPYLFAPHRTGWETNAVADGNYSLEAIAVRPGIAPLTVDFTVSNTAANLAAGGTAQGSTAQVGADPQAG